MSQFPPAFFDLHDAIDFLVADDDMVVVSYTASGTQDGPLGGLPLPAALQPGRALPTPTSTVERSRKSGPESAPLAGMRNLLVRRTPRLLPKQS